VSVGIGVSVTACGGMVFGATNAFNPGSGYDLISRLLAIVVLGGMGSQMGVVLAALLLVTLPEFGRAFAEFRMLVFGAAMVGIMVWRPRGLLARREPSLRLAAWR